jgi:hypothetical protein
VTQRLNVGRKEIDALMLDPDGAVEGGVNGARYVAKVAIPRYGEEIRRHYDDIIGADLKGICARAGVPFDFRHFGIVCEFDEPFEVQMHDDELVLDQDVKGLIDIFGPVILKNAFLRTAGRRHGQKNIFPHLHFHFDRAPTHANQFSLFTRDPFDPEQLSPRSASTVFVANIAAYLQCRRERQHPGDGKEWLRSNHHIFADEDMGKLSGRIILEHAWDAPEGTGEIAVIDNRTVLHANYSRDERAKAWRIGAHYLF